MAQYYVGQSWNDGTKEVQIIAIQGSTITWIYVVGFLGDFRGSYQGSAAQLEAFLREEGLL